MKFQVVTAAAALAATAGATPNMQVRQTGNFPGNNTVPDNTPFTILSIRTESELQYASLSASQDGLFLLAQEQGATCPNGEQQNSATFFLSKGELNLYTPSGVTQKFYTDRTIMGDGILQYRTSPGGRETQGSESRGWGFDEYGNLDFIGASLVACPSSNGAYSVWVWTGVANPGGNADCVGVNFRATIINDPVPCTYSYTPANQ
ncbi:cell wall protein PhiA [Diaporthe helianthi]|uniref:Cell wall protein PhiA n=1 Tax=Diaporthe helianthi TaxID=158607 RepID=A0A2P5HXB1_DIAHE|nr:cell wall protein PhiA [Diaporthe helianthi]